MGVRSGSVTFTRYQVQGALPRDLRARFLQAIQLRAFQPITPEDEALEASGWCVMERPFDLEFDPQKIYHDRYLLLGLRVDRYRIPPALLRSHMEEEEQRLLAKNGREKLSRKERQELKLRVTQRLRKRIAPSSKVYDWCWDLDGATLLFFSHSVRQRADFCALFEKTFSLSLLEVSPFIAAKDANLPFPAEPRLQALEPFNLSEGRKTLAALSNPSKAKSPTAASASRGATEANQGTTTDLAERVETTRFLGSEFLLWVWLRGEIMNQAFELGEWGSFDVWLDNQLTFESPLDSKERVTVRGVSPSGTAEAKEAVKAYKMPVRARLVFRNAEREFTLGLVAQDLAISGGKLPAVLTKESDDAFLERMYLVEQMIQMLHVLFARFLAVRLPPTFSQLWQPAWAGWLDSETLPPHLLAQLAAEEVGEVQKKSKRTRR